jgi:hypothetical protein
VVRLQPLPVVREESAIWSVEAEIRRSERVDEPEPPVLQERQAVRRLDAE